MHVKCYRRPEQFLHKSVLIVGGSISGTECAGDIGDNTAANGPTCVTLLTRKMRRFVGKERDGKSLTSSVFNQLSCHLICSGASTVAEDMLRLCPKFDEHFNNNGEVGLSRPASQRFINCLKSGKKLKIKNWINRLHH